MHRTTLFATAIFLVLIITGISTTAQQQKKQIDSKAQWLWYPEEFSDKTNYVSRYTRVSFECKDVTNAKAAIYFISDDNGRAWINETALGNDRKIDIDKYNAFNVDGLLKQGSNLLCIEVGNGTGPGGLIARLEIKYADGSYQEILSDDTWKISKTAENGWTNDDFDDSQWVNAKALGGSLTNPWTNIYNFRYIYNIEEQNYYQIALQERQKKLDDLKAKLKQEEPITVKLDIRKDAYPQIVINGESRNAILYDSPYPWPYDNQLTVEKLKGFSKSGIKFFVLGIDAVDFWRSDNSINFDEIENRLYRALLINEDAYLMLVINTTQTPKWWLEQHKDELIDYAAEGINWKEGDPINNVAAPSMASEVWRHDFGDYVGRIVRHVENIPAGKRVFAYRIDNGIYREWHYFGMRTHMPDTSKPMLAYFKKYLAEKYVNDDGLQKAWRNKNVTIADMLPPTAEEYQHSINDAKILRDPIADAKVIDYLHCMQNAVRESIIFCNRTVKENCEYRKLCGNYYGYCFGMSTYPAEGWHLQTDQLLDAPEVDFNSAPNLYAFRDIDDSEFGRNPVESYILRGKLQIQEHDSRTHLADKSHAALTFAHNADESVSILSRDFAQSLTRNAGQWYLDFSADWYNDPKIFSMFRSFNPILDSASKLKNTSVSEIALILDLESVYYHRINNANIEPWNDGTVQELAHSGAPFDVLLLNDLTLDNVSDYKLYVFMNMFYVTAEKQAIIQKLRNAGKTIVWMYAPGYLTATGANVKNITDLTGFKVIQRNEPLAYESTLMNGQAMKDKPNIYKATNPSFIINDADATALAYSGNTELITLASNKYGDSTQYYSTTGYISSEYWRQILKASNIHCYEASGKCIIHASSAFVCINGKPGKHTINLPKAKTVCMIFPMFKLISENAIDNFDVELTPEIGSMIFLTVDK